MTLEQWVSRLENDLAERENRSAERHMWLYWYSRSAILIIAVALIVYLALSVA